LDELDPYRRKYLTSLILEEIGELAKIDQDVMEAIQSNFILSENIQDAGEGSLSFGYRLADQIATFRSSCSWGFIVFFFCLILIWIATNIFFLATKTFNPFILGNLILSCLMANQAPCLNDESKPAGV
jgi:uncharacterized membrane protein